jgi:hypothetical protein
MVKVHEFNKGLVRLSHAGWNIPIWISTRDVAFLLDKNGWWCLIEPDLAYVYGMLGPNVTDTEKENR